MTGDGMEEFFVAVDEARKEYETFVPSLNPPCYRLTLAYSDYKPELDKIVSERVRRKFLPQSKLIFSRRLV